MQLAHAEELEINVENGQIELNALASAYSTGRYFRLELFSHFLILVEDVNVAFEWQMVAACNECDMYHYPHGRKRAIMSIFPVSMSMTLELGLPQAEGHVSLPSIVAFSVFCR